MVTSGSGSAAGGGTYSDGDSATLLATPNPGFFFVFWGGDLNDVTNPLSVTVTQPLNVTANFSLIGATHNVSVAVSSPGTGSVTGSGSYSAGETAMLMATPATGYTFLDWSGDVAGTQNPIAVIIAHDLDVTANFGDTISPIVTPPGDLSVTATGELTSVSLGSASAFDQIDGPLSVTPDQTGPFAPGTHLITWSATDTSGNTGTAIQMLTVTPLVGDIRLDGSVNSVDVMLAFRILDGSYTPSLGELQRADVAPIISGSSSPDGEVNAADVLQIMRIVAGEISP